MAESVPHFELTTDTKTTVSDAQRIRRGVGEAAAAVIGEARFTPLRIFVRDDSGDLIGGLVGGTYWRWLHVESLWIREAHRKRGIGTELMARAESEAVRRGCEAAYLDTYSFQAKPFYERLGYRVAGSIPDYPAGHTRLFMCKRPLSATAA